MAKLIIQNKYGTVPNELLKRKDISFKAKGLYAYIQSKPDDWDFSIERMEASDWKDSIRSGIRELEAAGYLSRKIESLGYSKFETTYTLYSTPQSMAENSMAEKSPSKNTTTNNPPSNKERNSKQEYSKQEVILVGSKDPTAQEAPDDRNSEIETIISSIRKACESCKPPRIYKKGKMERERAWNIATAKDFGDAAEGIWQTRSQFAANIVITASLLPYAPATYNAETVYANYARIYDEAIKAKMKSNQQRWWTVEA